MKDKPLVSIMIPTYKQEEYIGDAIESALEQTYENIEVVVCDDNSPDRTWEVIKRYDDPRLRVFRNNKNLGKSGNYQRLLYELIKGELAVNLDGDDYYIVDDYIERAVNDFFLKDDEIVLVQAQRIVEREKAREFSTPLKAGIVDGKQLLIKIFEHGYPTIYHMTAIYFAELGRKLDFYKQGICSDDLLALYKLIVHGKVGTISEYVGVHRFHGENITADIDYLKNIITREKTIEHAKKVTDIDPGFLNEIKKKEIKRFLFRGLSESIKQGQWKKAKKILFYGLENGYFFLWKLPFAPEIYMRCFPNIFALLPVKSKKKEKGEKNG